MIRYGNLKFVMADNEWLKKEIYRLRYQIYVEEFGFEDPADHPGQLETDAYEPYSIHFAAIQGEEVVGTIRLVLHSVHGFPIEHAVHAQPPAKIKQPELIGEISRLAISKRFRRREEDGRYGVESYLRQSEGGILPDEDPVSQEHKKRKHPVIVMGLYQIMYQESKRRRLRQWYMITEKKIYYSLKKFGFQFQQFAEPVQYHGLRVPYIGVIPEIEQRIIRENPMLLKLVLRGLEKRYHPDFGLINQLRLFFGFPYFAGKAWRYWKGYR